MIQIALILLIIAALTAFVDPLRKHLPKARAAAIMDRLFGLSDGKSVFYAFSRTIGSGTHVDLRLFGTYLRASETIDADFQNATGFAAFFLKDISSFTGVILNILLYYPMGFLLTILFPRLKAYQIILIGCGASVATELTQHLLKMGWCELDDILFNTLGAVIGLFVRRLQLKCIRSGM